MKDIKDYIEESEYTNESFAQVFSVIIKTAPVAIAVIKTLSSISSTIVRIKDKYDEGEIKTWGEMVKICISEVQSLVDKDEIIKRLFELSKTKVSDYVSDILDNVKNKSPKK